MKRLKRRILIISSVLCLALLGGCSAKSNTIIMGSKDFDENIILAEIMAQLIENQTQLKVERKLNMGGTFVNFEAIKNGQIDIYPEYTGTALTAQLKMDVLSDANEVYEIVKDEFDKQFDIKWLKPFGFNNTYAMGVAPDIAEKYQLEKNSDLVPIANELIFGAEHEFFDRQDGFDGFIATYNIDHFKENAKMNVSLKYQAIGEKKIDVTDVFATDGQIIKYSIKVLEDDLHFFPPYYAAPIIRNETLKKHPELEEVLNKLEGKIDDKKMTQLNYKVQVEKQSVEEVAKAFLETNNLIK
ncbi:glycine/betaine ABC transporter substrate-binding protein [Sporanaerobium hydrogeniformans]|uniref:Glycine/betaine ABC transporter substrate-binding protein n=1 Tax=Sporanaerobium hydrogeniformans TaxID=3072179 RepID=A0AC61DB00_9FIRM|nr:glycine betaine ABC transporter substrate-binding protein [Sporanaerobium hydrogeniformans]PHV69898.1 glycine/betaine ABC transporter substrate-binding protein [Sporanaerobium hydrogeniformans]